MSFSVNGFETGPLFSAEEVASLQEAIARHIDRTARAMLKPYADTFPDAPFDERIELIAEHDQSFAQLLGMAAGTDAFRDPVVAGLANDIRLAELARELAGCEIDERIFRFRVNSSALPQGRQAWHSDVSQLDEGDECSRLRVTAWIPLSDAGPESGGLELVPGLRDNPLPHDATGIKQTIPAGDLAAAATVAPVIRAGECLLMDRFTPHRALLNHGGKTRWSLVVWMKGEPVRTFSRARDASEPVLA